MMLVGLTGGIGSGKSTVSAMLAKRGAVVIDADRIAREVVEPGGPAYQGLVDRYGPAILADDGTVDRPALAAIAFASPEATEELGRLTHPAIGAVISDSLVAEQGTDHLVVLDVPLLAETSRRRPEMSYVLVVDAPPEVALERVVSERGMDPADVRARMAAQVGREERLARADFVIDNSGSLEQLEERVGDALQWIHERWPEGRR